METPSRIEPIAFEGRIPESISNLAVEIQQAASGLDNVLHPDSALELADMVRIVNSYYSNLIEGHRVRPKDIEMALAGAELDDEAQRPLALEARAHVLVQRHIDHQHRTDALPSPVSAPFISDTHRLFYENMPPEFRYVVRQDGTKKPIVPGAFREASEDDVAVGRHIPPSSDRISAFMAYFEKRFTMVEKGAVGRIVAIATAHHRLNYIHPFQDGNGRVSRLMSHAMALRAGLGANGLWSISRGLARGLKDRTEYKRMMDYADIPRQGDRDGRGNLSERALLEYCEWFLTVMLDQIRFSTYMFDLDRLDTRYQRLVSDVLDDPRAPDLASAVLRYGTIDRGMAPLALKTSERTARKTLSDMVQHGFLKSDTPKGPVRIGFPLDYRERLFPNLFTDVDLDPPEPPGGMRP